MSMYHAITVTRFYLDKKKWCVKWIRIEHRKSGQPYWFVSDITEVKSDKDRAIAIANYYAKRVHVPFIEDINKGMNLTKHHIAVLAGYGIFV